VAALKLLRVSPGWKGTEGGVLRVDYHERDKFALIRGRPAECRQPFTLALNTRKRGNAWLRLASLLTPIQSGQWRPDCSDRGVVVEVVDQIRLAIKQILE
jgi:hypothetical protein